MFSLCTASLGLLCFLLSIFILLAALCVYLRNKLVSVSNLVCLGTIEPNIATVLASGRLSHRKQLILPRDYLTPDRKCVCLGMNLADTHADADAHARTHTHARTHARARAHTHTHPRTHIYSWHPFVAPQITRNDTIFLISRERDHENILSPTDINQQQYITDIVKSNNIWWPVAYFTNMD